MPTVSTQVDLTNHSFYQTPPTPKNFPVISAATWKIPKVVLLTQDAGIFGFQQDVLTCRGENCLIKNGDYLNVWLLLRAENVVQHKKHFLH